MPADPPVPSAAADRRVERLDLILGDPWSAGNPLGFANVVAADERHEVLVEATRRVDAFGLGSDLVPVELGGRLDGLEGVVEIVRTLWRRDPCIGLGVIGSLVAATSVWAAGSAAQRDAVAGLLLSNGTIAAAPIQPATGAALRTTDGSVSGQVQAAPDLDRAEAIVLFGARSPAGDSRPPGPLLILRADLPAGCARPLPRIEYAGMRGVRLAGIELSDCRVAQALGLDTPDRASDLTERSLELTEVALAAACVGVLDTALRTVLSFGVERRLYGDRVSALPYVRAVVARAFTDLLTVDALATAALQAIQVASASAGIHAAAITRLGMRILVDAMDSLRMVLGAKGYIREGPHAIFQKLLRDLGSARVALGWPAAPPRAAAPPIVALLDDDTLRSAAGRPGLSGRLAGALSVELRRLRRDVGAAASGSVAGGPLASCELASREAVLVAATAVLALFGPRRDARIHPLDQEIALPALLDRLCGRLGSASVVTDCERARLDEAIFEQVLDRHRSSRLFDLSARRVPG
jgi:alkylation response protein AidB-like acyl-CoA dehydrogenase